MDAVELGNVSVVRGGKHILDSVDLRIARGENVAIIGPNGSGKTTLVKLIRGEVLPYYDEEDPATFRLFGLERWNVFELRSRMGIVSMDLQDRFREETTVREFILSGFFSSLDVFRCSTVTEPMASAAESAARTLGIEGLLDSPIGVISLGEMRRALIARALVTEPEMLVLDEPMTGLDISMKGRFRAMFDILMENGVSIVMVTHDLTDIPVGIDRIVMVGNGRIVADGPKERLLTDERVSQLYGEDIRVECDDGIYRMHIAGTVIG